MQHHIRKVAVLGAGVMGAQIAAHMVNAGINTLLYELPADGDNKNANVDAAVSRLGKLKPAPLGQAQIAGAIQSCNYDQHLPLLKGCDLIIEAIAERLDWKKDLYEKIAPFVRDGCYIASNTSGLSMRELADALPEELREEFCGVHFFNPPRYMHLVELIPHAGTRPEMLDHLEVFLTTVVGKGVVRAKDTPNFIGNRVGVFSMLATMHHTQAFGLAFDVVDALTGPAIGRPKSATYRTADVVGLDTMAHVISTMQNTLTDDPWSAYYKVPEVLQQLIDAGALGQKSGAGFYRKQGKSIQVLNTGKGDYVVAAATLPDEISTILKERDPVKRMAALHAGKSIEAQFLWALLRDLFHYCAVHLGDIAASAREIDQAMRWGYGWQQGPFETWQASDWQQISAWIQADIEAGKTMADIALPDWVNDGREGVHDSDGSYSAADDKQLPRSALPVYRRQLRPQRLVGEPRSELNTIEKGRDWLLWSANDDILIISFTSKMHSISTDVITGLMRATELAEQHYHGLVIWQESEPFCVGADLKGALNMAETDDEEGLQKMLADFQKAVMRLRYCAVPTVAAVRGMALGGGCEIMLHCTRTVAAFESYIGLVEAGVGLLPGGGGLKEMALRAVENTAAGDSFPLLQKYYEQIAMGKVANSALEALEFGYLRPFDKIVMHADEVLHVAIHQAQYLIEAGYKPPLSNQRWPAAGDVGIATLKMMLVNMHEGHFISDHDLLIAEHIATVICGGAVDRGSKISEQWLLDLERKHFLQLTQTPKTRERIAHMLKTGKPLRN